MSNVLAIAQKELRSYFVSPIAYVVVGFFAILFGYFYVASLSILVRFSMQAGMFGMGGPQSININEFMVRPLLSNTAIVLLFFLPFLTARAYAEEKKSGTIELLLTSPLSDLQIIFGKFLGALTLFVLAVFLGLELITKVPATLHTPLMSGSNAISGITLIGALVSAGTDHSTLTTALGVAAVALATINVVGGFLVTDRMLAMFRTRRKGGS